MVEEPCCQISHKTAVIVSVAVISALLIGSVVYAVYYFSQSASLNPSATKNVVTPEKTITASPSAAATDHTAGWKTYTNSKFGYSIKYPEDFFKYPDSVMPSTDGIYVATSAPVGGNGPKFQGTSDLWLNASAFPTSETQSFGQFAISRYGGNANRVTINFGGVPAYKYIYQMPGTTQFSSGPYTVEAIIEENGNTYIVSLSSWTKSLLDSKSSMFDNILAAFKFLDVKTNGDVSTWKTYTSNIGKFSFKYPSNWLVSYPLDGNALDLTIYSSTLDISDGTTFVRIDFTNDLPLFKSSDSVGVKINVSGNVFQEKVGDTVVGGKSAVQVTDLVKTSSGEYTHWYNPTIITEVPISSSQTLRISRYTKVNNMSATDAESLFNVMLSTFKFM